MNLQNSLSWSRPPSQLQTRPDLPWMSRKVERAFTLLEVMIACAIFFIAVFAILALVANTLRNAQRLRRVEVDAGMVAAQLFKTNRVTEGKDSGNFGDIYPDYTWETDAEEAFPFTNGLWQVDITVWKRGRHEPFDQISVWVYSPDSRSSALGRH
jgi:type II secretory pathway pseudopilin PulG